MELNIDLDEFCLEGETRKIAWESAIRVMQIAAEAVDDRPEFFDYSARGRVTLQIMDYVSGLICRYMLDEVFPELGAQAKDE